MLQLLQEECLHFTKKRSKKGRVDDLRMKIFFENFSQRVRYIIVNSKEVRWKLDAKMQQNVISETTKDTLYCTSIVSINSAKSSRLQL